MAPHQQVFVYGTLLRGEVNHHLLAGARWLGAHRTQPCFTMYLLGAYPGVSRGGGTAVSGEVFRLSGAGLRRLDRLEEFPRLYDRHLITTAFGRAWIYLYRGDTRDRPRIRGGDWRAYAADPESWRCAGVRGTRDPKNPRHRRRRPSVSDLVPA